MPAKLRRDPNSEIYAVVRALPRGRVVTYGELAELASLPRGHRIAARAMRTCPDGLPWHRVLGKKDPRRAQISIGDPEHARRQRRLLEAEGVKFDENGFVPLRRFGVLRADAKPERAPSKRAKPNSVKSKKAKSKRARQRAPLE